MIYNIQKFNKENFEVKLFIGHDTYFIVSENRPSGQGGCVYLHRDGTLRDYCGDPNFFDTKTEAYTLLDRTFCKDDILDEELFEI